MLEHLSKILGTKLLKSLNVLTIDLTVWEILH